LDADDNRRDARPSPSMNRHLPKLHMAEKSVQEFDKWQPNSPADQVPPVLPFHRALCAPRSLLCTAGRLEDHNSLGCHIETDLIIANYERSFVFTWGVAGSRNSLQRYVPVHMGPIVQRAPKRVPHHRGSGALGPPCALKELPLYLAPSIF
jgi:hypothetical protein